MANGLYQKYRQAALSWSDAAVAAAIDLKTDTIKCVPVTSSYAVNLATHQFLSDLGANTLGTAQTLTWSSDANGVYKASNPSFASVPAGTVAGFVIYKDTGTASTSPLIFYIDGKFALTAAAAATTSATSVTVDPLTNALASGASVAFSGGTTATLTSAAAAGARTLAVSALSGGIAQGETATPYNSGAGLPITSTGSSFTISLAFDATNGVFKI